jgi:hypothetical protein
LPSNNMSGLFASTVISQVSGLIGDEVRPFGAAR